jgi:3-dehydroquinate synthase
MSERISVGLGARSYDIHVGAGLLADAGALLAPLAAKTVPVVTDTNVAKLHLDALTASMKSAGLSVHPIVVEAGEATKSFAGLERLCTSLLQSGVERGGLIVALGGGVIGDLTGFAAGVLKRGIDFAQIPTTLLAQVDSSVGGKTAINTTEGKNLVGLFHQPRIVIADVGLLATLPPRQLRAGYAEVVKYGALGDAEFFAWLEAHGAEALAGDDAALTRIVAHSCLHEGRYRRTRRTRDGRPRAPQSRSHVRPCSRSGDRLFDTPAAWRRCRDRDRAGLPAFGAAGTLATRGHDSDRATFAQPATYPPPSPTS